MRSLASLDNADKRRRDQTDRLVSRERGIDGRRSAKTHVWPQRTHPFGGTVTGYLGHIGRTPTFRSGGTNQTLVSRRRAARSMTSRSHISTLRTGYDDRVARLAMNEPSPSRSPA